MDLYNDILTRSRKLDQTLRNIPKVARDYAKAQSDYRIMLAEKVLKLEDEGRPVTNLQIIARGDKQVAAAKSREIMTEALYKATLERVNVQKLQIKLLSEQLNREWNNG